jgi:uncharacterized protein (TIGR02145 family)
MKRTKSLILTASVALAMALMFSCSSDDGGENPNNGGGNSSSSSGRIVAGVSSSSGICNPASVVKGTFTDARNGQTYNTVKICSQTWMAENLNYNAPGSKCGNGDALSDANTATCDTYGRLYDWATAMALPANCNEEICVSQITEKHRGVCPAGWHISSDAEWTTLTTAIGGASKAGKKLKATSGWASTWNSSGNGDDTYGFAALPGGSGGYGNDYPDDYPDGYSYQDSTIGFWWIDIEYYNSSYAYDRNMGYYFEDVINDRANKSHLFSVRCVQD